jgi:sterol desaturase/sphingolipid hydroxylase (fatty acid hydroxylase superfamily)
MDLRISQVALTDHWAPALLWGGAAIWLVATLEGVVKQALRQHYDWRAYAASLADAVGRAVLGLFGLSVVLPLMVWVHEHRLGDLTLDRAWQWLVLFLGQELCYYVYHRSAHRMRWFWATHAVHHSPNELTLATALRLGWTGKLAGNALFYLPLVWLGFAPRAVMGALAANLLYQFWLHNTWMPRLGPLEWVLNTPSHHRVHHGSNEAYRDCNYGGVLIVFDRMFGSFVAQRDDLPPRYGLAQPLTTYNPVKIALHEWISLGRDLRHAPSWRAVLRMLFGPPGSGRPRTEP